MVSCERIDTVEDDTACDPMIPIIGEPGDALGGRGRLLSAFDGLLGVPRRRRWPYEAFTIRPQAIRSPLLPVGSVV